MPLKTDLVWGGLAASSADGVSGALPWGTQSSGQRQRPPVPFKRHAAGSARIDSSAPAAARRSPEPLLPRRMRFLTIRDRQTTARLEPAASQNSQTNRRALVGGRGGAILVQLSELTRPGHRGIDAVARAPLARSPGSESRRSSAVRSADPRARKGQQDP